MPPAGFFCLGIGRNGIGKMFQEVPCDVATATELYESGLTLMEISERLGCSWMTVKRRLVAAGIEVRKRGRRKDQSDALISQVLELHHKGICDREIADTVGVNASTVSEYLRKAGIHRGKGSNSSKGGKAKGEKSHADFIARLGAIADKVKHVDGRTVRCAKCGHEFTFDAHYWKLDEPCPECRSAHTRSTIERKRYEREQQREAAREWRLSVPRICKECGEPFYSEHDNATYCCDSCKRRSKNRKATARKQRRGEGAGSYRHRMRIERTPATYDRTVTLGAVYKKFNGRCCSCGCMTYRTKGYAPNQATLDHKIALANNGTHTWDNVQLLCSDCNSMKRDVGQMRLPIAV